MTISRTASAWSRPLAGTALSQMYELEEMRQAASEKRQAAELEVLLDGVELVHLNFINLDFGEKASSTCSLMTMHAVLTLALTLSLCLTLSVSWRRHHAPSLSLSPSLTRPLPHPNCSDGEGKEVPAVQAP